MTDRAADSPAQVPAKRLRFGRHVLDLDRGCLLLDGTEIALRPKTFAVLRCLVENSGRLVSKDELLAAVWPNLVVTDDLLVQSIGELRRALGDEGATAIRTIPRRGYRFESDVSVIGAAEQSSTDATPAQDAAATPSPTPVPGVPGSLDVLTTASARRRIGLFILIALPILALAALLLWNGSDHRRPGESPEAGAKPAIAVLALVDHSDEPGRAYPLGRCFGGSRTSPRSRWRKPPRVRRRWRPKLRARVWLFTLGPKGGSTRGGTKVAEIGPVPPISAAEYLLRVNRAGGLPGAKTPVHTHPGSEAFYVLTGRLGQKTPHGVSYAEAGQSMNGHGADMPMEVFSGGTSDLDQLVMFVVDATRPFSSPAKFD